MKKKIKIYLDVCCLSRPFDDQKQMRIFFETEAVITILKQFEKGNWLLVSSKVIEYELDKIQDRAKKEQIKYISKNYNEYIDISQNEINRAQKLENIGFHGIDALHLACAENSGADFFLTTDDQLLRNAKKICSKIKLTVKNPFVWLKEVIEQ